MLKWFRRRAEPPEPERSATKSAATRPIATRPGPLARRPPPPASLPEVLAEGSTEADWSAWEDSLSAWDSQLQGLGPSSRVQVRDDTRPSQLEEPDPFAGVRRKRDV